MSQGIDQYIIIDLDGCIADDRRRLPLIDHDASDPWAAYHADLINDPVANRPIIELIAEYNVFVFTARPEPYRPQTTEWLAQKAGLYPKRLFMREPGCRLPSPKLKERHLYDAMAALWLGPENFIVAMDDRPDVLLMYQLNGLNTLHITLPGYDAAEQFKAEVEGDQQWTNQ